MMCAHVVLVLSAEGGRGKHDWAYFEDAYVKAVCVYWSSQLTAPIFCLCEVFHGNYDLDQIMHSLHGLLSGTLELAQSRAESSLVRAQLVCWADELATLLRLRSHA